MPCSNGVGAVDLFEGDDEGEFVLEREGAEGPDEVGFVDQFAGVSVGPADEEGDIASVGLPLLELGGEGAAGEGLAVFVEDHAKAAFAAGQQFGGLAGLVTGLDGDQLERGNFFEAREILISSGPGVGESRFANGEDFPIHAG